MDQTLKTMMTNRVNSKIGNRICEDNTNWGSDIQAIKCNFKLCREKTKTPQKTS